MVSNRKKLVMLHVFLLTVNLSLFILLILDLISHSEIRKRKITPNVSMSISSLKHDSPRNHQGLEKEGSLETLLGSTNQRSVLIYPNQLRVRDRNIDELTTRVVPNNVFYVWCGNRTFEFKHYLSLVTVWYQLEPDVIEIHYDVMPREDKYNTWLTYLRTHLPALTFTPLPAHARGLKCGDAFGLEIVYDRGGIYLEEGTILGDFAILSNTSSFGFSANFNLGFAASKARQRSLRTLIHTYSSNISTHEIRAKIQQVSAKERLNTIHCKEIRNISNTKGPEISESKFQTVANFTCLILNTEIVPKDIINNYSYSLAAWLKYLIYGKNVDSFQTEQDSIVGKFQPKNFDSKFPTVTSSKIPRIVHYVWFGGTNMSFSMYLSFLSTVHIVKPNRIFIHSDMRLTGLYWSHVKTQPIVKLVYRDPPSSIFGKKVLYRQHRSDVVRADLLDKYGGVYLDWDAFWLRCPEDLFLSNHDVILSRDHMPRPPFPDSINMGVVMSKPRSKFIRAWRAALVDYKSSDFLYNAVELPYKVYEMFPDSVFIDDKLQVMCYYLKCHPTFHPDFRHWGRAQPFDWRRDAYAIHFTHPDPPAFANETALMSSTGMFAEIGKYIFSFQKPLLSDHK